MAANWLSSDLRCFLVLADELHFGRAAERMSVAQPVLSRRIRRLETTIGAVLFDRTSRMVALTEAGLILRDQGGRSLEQLDAAILAAGRRDPVGTAPLRVGFLSAAQALMPLVLDRWRTALDCPVQIVRAASGQQLEMLRTSRIDIGFLRPPAAVGSLAFTTIRREGIACVMPIGHPLASRQSLRLADLAGLRWVRHGTVLGTSFQQRMEMRLKREGIAMEYGVEADDTPSVTMLVAAGYGVALLPDAVLTLTPPGTVCRPIPEIRPFVRLAIARRRDDANPRIQKAIRIAAQAIQDAAVGGKGQPPARPSTALDQGRP
ncbi:LysR family transcriptional regulator [Stella humosa]|uniref:LysR family transcriptional regulator n=1 Tax=Stella humosa TaxID=94 RepID=A0A3N1KPT0_9PROT|nr:LysR substrate-binding domain-containing protein [Stella humosa]ROP81312.1 LysR family transcriptional regulator [Stella humosa]BBK32661.1 LysR family transcriptional regulator [Stella humosa]